MKAQNLTICVPNKGCDKDCPYCVSKMTRAVESNCANMSRNIEKVKTLAKAAQVNSVLLTGKGEPTKNYSMVRGLMKEFKDFPLELQTNGLEISKDPEICAKDLSELGLNVLAISIDTINQMEKFKEVIDKFHDLGILVRMTINMANDLTNHTFFDYLEVAHEIKLDQLSFRKITIPNYRVFNLVSDRAANWIRTNVNKKLEDMFFKDLEENLKDRGRVIRTLPYGATVYDIGGLSVTWFDYCIQDNSNNDDIRSLIFQEDGHLYTTWDSKASRIF